MNKYKKKKKRNLSTNFFGQVGGVIGGIVSIRFKHTEMVWECQVDNLSLPGGFQPWSTSLKMTHRIYRRERRYRS